MTATLHTQRGPRTRMRRSPRLLLPLVGFLFAAACSAPPPAAAPTSAPASAPKPAAPAASASPAAATSAAASPSAAAAKPAASPAVAASPSIAASLVPSPSAAAAPATAAAGSLKGVCPDTVVFQTNWWPEPDHGFLYQLIGPNG